MNIPYAAPPWHVLFNPVTPHHLLSCIGRGAGYSQIQPLLPFIRTGAGGAGPVVLGRHPPRRSGDGQEGTGAAWNKALGTTVCFGLFKTAFFFVLFPIESRGRSGIFK